MNRRLVAVLVGLALLLTVVVAIACVPPSHDVGRDAPGDRIGWLYAGNCTYIPLNLSGLSEANVEVVMEAIVEWEKSAPGREFVDFEVLSAQSAMGQTAQTFGVLIYSRLK